MHPSQHKEDLVFNVCNLEYVYNVCKSDHVLNVCNSDHILNVCNYDHVFNVIVSLNSLILPICTKLGSNAEHLPRPAFRSYGLVWFKRLHALHCHLSFVQSGLIQKITRSTLPPFVRAVWSDSKDYPLDTATFCSCSLVYFKRLPALHCPLSFMQSGLIQKITRSTLPPIPSSFSQDWASIVKRCVSLCCVHVCMHVFVCTYVCKYVCEWVCMCLCVYALVWVSVCVYVWHMWCASAFVCVCVFCVFCVLCVFCVYAQRCVSVCVYVWHMWCASACVFYVFCVLCVFCVYAKRCVSVCVYVWHMWCASACVCVLCVLCVCTTLCECIVHGGHKAALLMHFKSLIAHSKIQLVHWLRTQKPNSFIDCALKKQPCTCTSTQCSRSFSPHKRTRSMLRKDPAARPTVQQLLALPTLQVCACACACACACVCACVCACAC